MPSAASRQAPVPFDRSANREIERPFGRLKDCRRIATNDQLASNFLAAIVSITIWWADWPCISLSDPR